MANFASVEKFFNRNEGKKGELEGMDVRHVSLQSSNGGSAVDGAGHGGVLGLPNG